MGQEPRHVFGRYRRIKDNVAKYTIVAGGVFVLITLLLIFCYLLYVTFPVLQSAQVTTKDSIKLPPASRVLVDDAGELVIAQAEQETLAASDSITSSATLFQNAVFASSNSGLVLQPQASHWRIYQTKANPQANPLLPVDLPDVVTTETSRLVEFDGHIQQQQLSSVLLYSKQFEYLHYDIAEQKLNRHQRIDLPVSAARILLNHRLDKITVFGEQRLLVYQITDNSISLLYDIHLSAFNSAKVVDLAPVNDGNMLLVGRQDGEISLWSEVALADRQSIVPIRYWQSEQPVVDVAGSYQGLHFVVADAAGKVTGFYATNEKPQWQYATSLIDPRVNINNTATQVIAYDNRQLIGFEIYNPHPDVSFSALFNKLWYQGYATPEHVWQINPGGEENHKFGLIPLTMGTLKVTFIAMLVAIPLAVFAAIYSAFFMSEKMRQLVKPTIEMIEALPTVVLGFIAGIWLAPLIEANLLAVLMLLFTFPLSVLVAMTCYLKFSKLTNHRELYNWLPIGLIPLLLMSVSLTFSLASSLDAALFADGFVRWLELSVGIDYQQRNSLVIGLLMGFAVIPTVYTLSEEAVAGVPKHLTRGALALGASRWQTVTHVVFLTASSGIFAAIMIGFGRVVGETMIVLMASGNVPIADWDILNGIRTLTANLALEIPEARVGSSHYRVLFLSALLLLSITFVLNSVAEIIRQRLRKKYSEM